MVPRDGEAFKPSNQLPGNMFVLDLGDETLMVQSGAFVASTMTVEVDIGWGGARTFFASEGLIMLRCGGSGPLILSSYGAIHDMSLEASQSLTVDTDHLASPDS